MNRGSIFELLVGFALALLLWSPEPVAAQTKADVDAAYNKAEQLRKAGKHKEAAQASEEVVRLARRVFGENHVAVAPLMSYLASLYQATGQDAKAEPLFRRSLEIEEMGFGREHPYVATTLNRLAILYQAKGQYNQAEPLFKRSLEIRENTLGRDHPDVATSLGNLAGIYRNLAEYSKAEPLYQRSLKIRESKLGRDHLDVATSLNNLALLYQDIGEYTKAEPLYQRSLKIYETKLGPEHRAVATSLNNLAVLYEKMGHYAKAEPLYRRSLEIRESKLGRDHLDVATSLNNLAGLYQDIGQHGKAALLYLRSLEIRESKLGPDHPEVAASLGNLARLYRGVELYAKAEPLFRRSLEIEEMRFGRDHPFVATTLNNLAGLYRAVGQYNKAEPLFQRSLEIRENKLGRDHPSVAQSLSNLALLYRDIGEYTKAESLSQRSLKICETRLGPEHRAVATSLEVLAMLYALMDQPARALPMIDRMRSNDRWFVTQLLPLLSQKEQQLFLDWKDLSRFHAALTFSWRYGQDQTVRSKTAAWLLNGKAQLHEAASNSVRAALASQDPLTGKLATELHSVRAQVARLTLKTPAAGQEQAFRQKRQQLADREQELAKQLQQRGSRSERADPWVRLEELCQRLPTDGIFVDIARFSVYDFQAKHGKAWGPARYVAWLTFPTGKVEMVDLGAAEPIDALVKQVRQALQQAPKAIRTEGEPEAEKQLREPLEALSRKVLHPLLPHIGKKSRWILSPDADLWLVPWNALTLPNGDFAIEKHTISYVTSGRDLVAAAIRPQVQVRPPLILADPDFGLDKDDVVRQSQALGRPGEEELRSGLFSALLQGVIKRLPGTATEAQAVAPRLKQYAGVEPQVYLQEKAVKATFRSARNPKALMLSTHGFFLPEPDKEKKGDVTVPVNPLLRCGLLLAGCNDKTAPEQGILTGLEVVGTDLRGCELVVLSACETGLGETRQGEGVAGLRQCFQLAGADAVVATLWQVPDRQSAQQMSRFFTLLAEGKGKAEALAQAQREMIAARREENAAAHPFFWAAFTVTGEADLATTPRGGR